MRAVLVLLILASPAWANPQLPVCDEVSVLLGTAGPECSLCSGYPSRKQTLPVDRLTPNEIRASLTRAKVLARFTRCGRVHDGTSKLRVTVAPSGRVTRSILVTTTGLDNLDRCLMAAVRAAKFPASDAGETFTMPVRY